MTYLNFNVFNLGKESARIVIINKGMLRLYSRLANRQNDLHALEITI